MIQVQMRITADAVKKGEEKPRLSFFLDLLEREDVTKFERSIAEDIQDMFEIYFSDIAKNEEVQKLWNFKIEKIPNKDKADENTNPETNP